ncbi:transient-receptor-potential-like protein [Tubulanus polymorphus]|uniref:transient-receptor-potential-like protein n=1 Tax=Tubulanus polymorphus TaxID=672921 RepID=UPI003DA6739E
MDNLAPDFRGSKRNRPMRSSSKSSGRAVPIPLEPLKEGHRMDPHERLFLEAAEKGDKHTMIRCLQGPSPVNVNCTNILGRSAIQIAVDNENTEIVELLLKQEGVKIGDAILYAIREGVYRIVEMLIDHPSISRGMLGFEWSKSKPLSEQSNEYSPDISPVILAATCNQFEILQLLLSRGAKIENPHTLSCACQRCLDQVNEDSLRHSLLRIHTFRALASPAWISLTSADPILTAFRLSWELQRLAMKENEFKDTYTELAESCKKYACDLLDQCRSSEEVIAVLDKSDDEDDDEEDGDTDKLTLARLKLALKYEQKQFVAHPHCQQLLTSIWYEGLPGWRTRNTVMKVAICIGLPCILPFLVLIYLTVPRSRVGQLLRSPFMKFMYHSASFAVFLVLLLLMSTTVAVKNGDIQARSKIRGPWPNALEWLIVLWVLGFVWAEVKQLWEEGLRAYIRQWWNWMDFIMLSLYLCTFSLRIVAYIQLHYMDADFGRGEMPRSEWPDMDPTIISEGLFAVANVFSFARIIYLFQANPHLGPLQISLGCMLIDIIKFLLIFFLVLTSFACGLNQLYFYYVSSTDSSFVDLDSSFVTLFWSLFGLGLRKDIYITPDRSQHQKVYDFPEKVGETLFIVYHGMAIIVLLNMLIAMMSNSFQSIEDHADREWKFARSKLWMGYFDEGSTLPSPFNIIISPKSVYYMLRAFKRLLCKCMTGKKKRKKARRKSHEATIKANTADGITNCKDVEIQRPTYNGDSHHGHVVHPQQSQPAARGAINLTQANNSPNSDLAEQAKENERQIYQEVMRRLVSRYIHQTKKQLRQDGVNEDDLLEIKQDISSLRYELREDRKREAARATGHLDNLKRDILRNLRSSNMQGPAPPSEIGNTMPTSTSGTFLTQTELEYLKREIVTGLRQEIADLIHEVVPTQPPHHNHVIQNSPCHLGTNLPAMNSDLYHTHLYTQL